MTCSNVCYIFLEYISVLQLHFDTVIFMCPNIYDTPRTWCSKFDFWFQPTLDYWSWTIMTDDSTV